MVELLENIAREIKEKVSGVQVVWSRIPNAVSDIQGLVAIKIGKVTAETETSGKFVWRYRYDIRIEIWTRLDNVLRWYEVASGVVNALNNKDLAESFTTLQMLNMNFLEQRGEYLYGFIDFLTFKIGG